VTCGCATLTYKCSGNSSANSCHFPPEPSKLAQLPWYEALILSVSSFHGRGFFQPLQSLGDPVAALASIEAVIGLLIEISFIATFTQCYFGNK
jgi:hypothetical protein